MVSCTLVVVVASEVEVVEASMLKTVVAGDTVVTNDEVSEALVEPVVVLATVVSSS